MSSAVALAYAQEESLSASENQKWRIRRNFESGMPWNGTMLGYRYNKGTLVIVPEEAKTVKCIFDEYLSGLGLTAITKRLNADGIPTRFGNAWGKSSVLAVLRNYAYTGNLLLQKSRRTDHLAKRDVPNNGELPQYHVENSHEAIIDASIYLAVQNEIQRRAEKHTHPGVRKQTYPFTVESILTNEKYKGAALLQKRFTVDFLQKKMKINEGEVPQYYVENSHPPIIQPDEWDRVQTEFQRRKAVGKNQTCTRLFSAQIICGDCGEFYGSKVWHSNSKYRRVIWQCNGKFKGDEKCRTPHLYDSDIQRLFLAAVSKLFAERETILETCRLMQSALTDNTAIDSECEEIPVRPGIISEPIP